MQLFEKVKDNEFLGREFLVWLWFRSDVREGRFSLGEAGDAELQPALVVEGVAKVLS